MLTLGSIFRPPVARVLIVKRRPRDGALGRALLAAAIKSGKQITVRKAA